MPTVFPIIGRNIHSNSSKLKVEQNNQPLGAMAHFLEIDDKMFSKPEIVSPYMPNLKNFQN